MKVTVTRRHIRAAQTSKLQRNPVEIALLEMECFEEVSLTPLANGFALKLDGEQVKLPRKVQQAIRTFQESGEMAPLGFDIKLNHEMPVGLDGFFSNPYEDDLGYGLSFRYA